MKIQTSGVLHGRRKMEAGRYIPDYLPSAYSAIEGNVKENRSYFT